MPSKSIVFPRVLKTESQKTYLRRRDMSPWTGAVPKDLTDKEGKSRIDILSVRDFFLSFYNPGQKKFMEVSMKKTIVWGTALACILTAPSHAQAGQEEQTITTLDEVVTSATKTEETRKDITNSVVIKDSIDIAESPAKSIGELLGNEPGIDWRTRGNYGGAAQEIHIRGMDADATQVFVNGVRINSSSLGTADVGKISLNSIDRIETVKGSGSLLYGSGAMGGVVNILTKRPERDGMDLAASAGYGRNDTYHLSAEHGMYVLPDFGYYFTVNRMESKGFRDNSDMEQTDISMNLVYDTDDDLDVSLYADYLDREYGLPGVKPPAGTGNYYINGVKFYNSESASLLDRGSNEDTHWVAHAEKRLHQMARVHLQGDYTRAENFNLGRYNSNGKGFKTWTTNTIRSTEGNMELTPLSGLSILAGGEYRDYDWKNESVGLNTSGQETGAPTTSKATVHTSGSFLETQYRVNEQFKFLLGIRHEQHSKFGYEDLPRFGALVNVKPDTLFKISHGKHFNAPTMNDLYWPDDGFMRGNPDLEPETGWHTDTSIEHTCWDDRVFFSLTYFDWSIDKKISWAENPNFPTAFAGYNYWLPANIDQYEATGWETGLTVTPHDNWRLSLSYTYTDAYELKAGSVKRQAQYTPNNTFKGTVKYTHDSGLLLTGIARFTGDRPAHYQTAASDTPQFTLESYWTADLLAEKRFLENWLISLEAANIFDKEYETYMANFRDQDAGVTSRVGYPGAGRSLFFKLTYEH